MRFGMIAAAAAALVCAGQAGADILTQTVSFSNRDGRNSYALFDPSLGKLQAVSGFITTTVYQPFSPESTFGLTGIPTYNVTGQFTFFGFPGSSFVSTNFSSPAVDAGYSGGPVLQFSYSGGFTYADADLAAFIGAGTSFVGVGNTALAVASYDNGRVTLRPNYGGAGGSSFSTLNLSYVYAVPEPASWAMIILGMGVVGYAMRRSNKNFDAKIKRVTAAVA